MIAEVEGEVSLVTPEELEWTHMLRRKAIGLREAAEGFEIDTQSSGSVEDYREAFEDVEEYFEALKELLKGE